MAQAAQWRKNKGYDEEVVLAAFLMILAYLRRWSCDNEMDGFGIKNHEEIGADFLAKKGFSKKLTRLVESHVKQKDTLLINIRNIMINCRRPVKKHWNTRRPHGKRRSRGV